MTYTFDPVQAREPTPEEWAEQVKEAQAAHKQLIAAVLIGRAAMWALAEASWRLNEDRGWVKLGYDTKGEYLAQPEINMSRATFDLYVRAWGGTVEQRQIPLEDLQELDVTKVDIVLPQVTRSKVSIEDALSDAKVLGSHDLREKYQGIPSPADPPAAAEDGPDDEGDDDEISEEELLGSWKAARDEMYEQLPEDSRATWVRLHRDTVIAARQGLDQLIDTTEMNDGQHE